jgi:hypothetical protein
MKIRDIITENRQGVAEANKKSADYSERFDALREIEKIRYNPKIKSWSDYTPEMFKRVVELSKITGRGMKMSGGRYYSETVGSFIDTLKREMLAAQKKSGRLPEFTGRASTAQEMANQIAAYTNGSYEYNKGRTWTTGAGQRYRDPNDFVVYPDESSYDDAWQWIESRGKKVHYYDNSRSLRTALQLGRYIVEPATTVLGVFSDSPVTTHRISVRSASAVNQGVRTRADITDQQAAALKDIAATRNATAMAGLQAMMAILKGEEDLKRVIDSSKKIDPRDKAKLDSIIAAAGKRQGSDD